MKKVLALDFEGFICDGLNECLLVTWNGYHEKALSDFSDQGLASLPCEFVERFKYVRNFAKHIGHFFVSLLDPPPDISSQEDFNALYASLPSGVIDPFVEKVVRYREQARNERKAMWLNYHTLYPGMIAFLANVDVPPYIVTAKDRESVIEILSNNALAFPRKNVFGEQRSKLTALALIKQLERVNSDEIHFFDDHLMNVLEARNAGYRAYWAIWGYHVPEQLQLASAWGIESISLHDFVGNQSDLTAEQTTSEKE
jgi:phosphoglycolate phosphatase-like HAD superfamily hydrolase